MLDQNNTSIMTTNNDELPKEADAVETEVAKGEQNETFEEHVQLKEEQIKKPRPKPKPKIVKVTWFSIFSIQSHE